MVTKNQNDLVNVLDIDDSLIVDLCLYNGSTIFNKEYNTNCAYVKKHIALKLKKANDIAKTYNLRIKVCDAYRPYGITKKHAIMRPDLVAKGLVAPESGSWHNAGLALDVTLVNEDGEEVVELQLDEFKAITEALQMYQKENSLQDVHISQLKDMIEKLEKENSFLKEKIQKLEKSSSKMQSVNKNIKIITDHLY